MANFSISKRIGFIMVAPILGLLILFSILAAREYNKYSEAGRLNNLVLNISELAELTHVLQAERLQSMKFADNRIVNSAKNLTQARSALDAENKKFHDMVLHVKEIQGDYIAGELGLIEDDLSKLKKFRTSVDSRSVTTDEVQKYYSKIIKHIFEVGFHASEIASDAKVALEIVAMLEVAEVMEYADQERQLMLSALAEGSLKQSQLVEFSKTLAIQELMAQNAVANLPSAKRAAFGDKIKSTETKALAQLRKKAFASASDLSVSGVSQSNWTKVSTDRIEKLRKLEKEISADLETTTSEIASASLFSLLFSIAISIAIIAISWVVGFFVTRSITKPLSGLVDATDKISRGDLEARIDGQNLVDEIGSMSRALVVFRDGAAERLKLEAAAMEENKRIEEQKAAEQAAKAKKAEEIQAAVNVIGSALGKLAQGDLSVSIDEKFGEELEELRVNFNASVSQLSKTLSEVNEAIHTIDSNSIEMRSAATELSTRTEDQANSLQEVSSAVDEISAAVQNSATDASSAAQMATTVSDSTTHSEQVVKSAIDAMARIEKASDEISSIITVMDEIAFQTNLLALNAGVEAARAGEAGKGFAVVAQEVRELAHRSASSANEIKELIGSSSEEVKDGVKFVTATGEALHTITGQIAEISKFINSIAEATMTQSSSLSDCSNSISSLDRSTQQNAAMAEESTAVIQNLANDASTLSSLVQRFKLQVDKKASQSKAA